MPYPAFPLLPTRGPIIERLAWMTSVLESFNGAEQRAAAMEYPRRGIEFPFSLLAADLSLAEARLFEIVYRNDDPDPLMQFTVPIWHDSQRLAANLGNGASNIPCATEGYSFLAGQPAILIASTRLYGRYGALKPDDYEVVTVDTVNANSIDIDGVTAADWAAADWILPAFEGVLQDMISGEDVDARGLLVNGIVRLESLATGALP